MRHASPINLFASGLLVAFLVALMTLLCVSLAGCESDETGYAGKDKAGEARAAIESTSTRVAAHIEAAKAALEPVTLTDAAKLAVLGNLDAALAALPRPSVDDLAYVAALKTVEDYRRAARDAEASAGAATRALDKAMRDLDAMREGRAQDRRDADARLWRLAAVGLVVAAAVTGYLFKDARGSGILGGAGILCAVLPVWLDKADSALAVGAWVVLGLLACAAAWVGRKLWVTETSAVDKAAPAP